MTKRKKKLTGKEHAKLNKRIRFYEKFERLCQRLSEKDNGKPLILLSMNKGISFLDFEDLSKIFEEDSSELEEKLDTEELTILDLPFVDEAYFILKAKKSKYLKILRQHTNLDNAGNERKGLTGSNENYEIQDAFNWIIELKNIPKILSLIENEKETPTEYDLEPKMARIEQPTYRKAWKPPRRRRR